MEPLQSGVGAVIPQELSHVSCASNPRNCLFRQNNLWPGPKPQGGLPNNCLYERTEDTLTTRLKVKDPL